jgi:hypothetical protein
VGGYFGRGGLGWGHRGGSYYFHGLPHHYSRFSLFFGPSFGWPYYSPFSYPYYPSYLYPPAVVTVPIAPPVYIERGTVEPSSKAREQSWYFCQASNGYYPYVKECSAGWIEIPPTPSRQDSGYWYRCNNPDGYYPYVRECPGGWTKMVPEPSKPP